MKWKGGEYKNKTTTTHWFKDPSNHFDPCNIYGKIEDKCWNIYLVLNTKKQKMEAKKKNMISMDSSNQVNNNSNVDMSILYTTRR